MDPNYNSEQRGFNNYNSPQGSQPMYTKPGDQPQYQQPVTSPQNQSPPPPMYQQSPPPNQPQYQQPPLHQSQYQQPSPVPIYQSQPRQSYAQVAYAQPIVVQPVPNAIVVNQPAVHVAFKARTAPMQTSCPFCKMPITTIANLELNCRALCCCIIGCYIFYACYQCCNDKDVGCYDCAHVCPNCGNTIGTYLAM